MTHPVFIDIHCHPSLKPYSRSYRKNKNSVNCKKRWSIWHQIKPDILKEKVNIRLKTTHFTQSDFQTLAEGNVRVVIVSLSPLEKGFFDAKWFKKGVVTDLIADLMTGIGIKKINFIQKNTDYFSELENEMDFYRQLHNKAVTIQGVEKKYRLVKNYAELTQNLAESEDIISVVFSIEGGHAFNENNTREPTSEMLRQNLEKVKNWEFKPLFVSPAHHFYNDLCGHAYSITNLGKVLLDQSNRVNTPMTELGKNFVRELLDAGILIDIKHLSRKSRRDYYAILEDEAYRDTPVIVSHGSVNGHATVTSDMEYGEENGVFYGSDINFFDDEIIKIGRSKGLFGLQLDERRIASKKEIEKIDKRLPDDEQAAQYSRFLWNQVLHIAGTLDKAGERAWDCMCIGSDYDGIVDPMNGLWTSAEFGLLYDLLLQQVKDFKAVTPNAFQQDENNALTPEEIVEKIFFGNVMAFLSVNYV